MTFNILESHSASFKRRSCNIHSSLHLGSSFIYSYSFTAVSLHLAGIHQPWLGCQQNIDLYLTLSQEHMCWVKWMDGWWGWYYWDDGLNSFGHWACTQQVKFSFLPGYHSFVWVTVELWMNIISSGSRHSSPGLSCGRCEAFLCFGISFLICYQLYLWCRGERVLPWFSILQGKACQRSWSKTCHAFQTKYLSITSDPLTNDNEKATFLKAQDNILFFCSEIVCVSN